MKRMLLLLLVCGGLLTAAGCGLTEEEPAPAPSADTAAPTEAVPTEAAPTEAAPTQAEPTGPVPTEPAPTEITAPEKGELGYPSFTLGGMTVTMGESPDRLLSYLGQPEETFEYGDSLYDGTDRFYHYKDIWVTAFQPAGSEQSVLTDVYFITDEYTVDGIGVSSTAADLRRAASSGAVLPYQEFTMHTEIGGYGYLLDPEQESPGSTYWAFLFTYEDDPRQPAEDAPILCMHVYYVYPFPLYSE